ncbi:hypothetical protein [Nonomuraea endophytica]|uniref:hypothetical protein n=1 Tax=Nonomuraea endophytica TaxID=714136 RepID=UPI0037CA0B7B
MRFIKLPVPSDDRCPLESVGAEKVRGRRRLTGLRDQRCIHTDRLARSTRRRCGLAVARTSERLHGAVDDYEQFRRQLIVIALAGTAKSPASGTGREQSRPAFSTFRISAGHLGGVLTERLLSATILRFWWESARAGRKMSESGSGGMPPPAGQVPPGEDPHPRRHRETNNTVKVALISGVFVVVAALIGALATIYTVKRNDASTSPAASTSALPAGGSASFVGSWEGTDGDGSTVSITIASSSGGTGFQLIQRDSAASSCKGAAVELQGSATLDPASQVLTTIYQFACPDSGSPSPVTVTYRHSAQTDTLLDSFNVTFKRK